MRARLVRKNSTTLNRFDFLHNKTTNNKKLFNVCSNLLNYKQCSVFVFFEIGKSFLLLLIMLSDGIF